MILTTSQVVEKFIEAGELYGLTSLYEGTLGGKLLFDKQLNSFVWLSESEFENLQYESAQAAQSLLLDKSRNL